MLLWERTKGDRMWIMDLEKDRNGSVLLKDNLRRWVDSAAINSVKGGIFFLFI